MDMKTSYAAQLYAKARTAAAPAPQTGQGANALGQFAQSFADTLAKGEQTATAAMTGGADPQALVQALANSQLAVETVSTLRDKVVEAYQEILRMPV
jgi:flagellar hook-basal body complex protein FliE